MNDKKHYDALLAKARTLMAAGDHGGARALLGALVDDPGNHHMGPVTVLGLPRRLHAAMLRLAKAEGDTLKRIGYQYTLVPPVETLAPYGQFTMAQRLDLASANRQPVPRIIHQIWIGPAAPPVTTDAWRAHAHAHGYEYRLWREDELDKQGVMSNPVFAGMLQRGDYPGAVDVARYIILERLGGIYLDCDWFPARDDISFDDLLPLCGLTAFAEAVPRNTGAGSVLLANSFIAVPPQHPVMRRILQALPQILHDLPSGPAWWTTGPLIFTVIGRAAAVSLAGADFVAATLPDGTPIEDVHAVRSALSPDDAGLLIAWKSW